MAGNNCDIVPDGIPSRGMQGSSNQGGVKECSICYQPMTSEENKTPRLLICGHTFCTDCLQQIYNTAGEAYAYRSRLEREILCPHCKTPCIIPDGDVLKLPKNYALLEIISEQPQVKTNPDNIVCKTHNIVKKSYCFNCQDLVCPYCQMINHQAHNCQITIEAIKVFLPDFQQNQDRLEDYSQQLKAAKDKFQATLYRLKENQREASHHINVRFSAIIDEAQKWKNINIRKLDDITKEREDILDQQIESLNDVIDETDRKLDLAKRVTSPQNEEEFFVHYKSILSETKVLVSKEMGLIPLVHEHIEWRVDPINHIIDLLNRIAFVNEDANACPSKSPPPLEPTTTTTEMSPQYMRSTVPVLHPSAQRAPPAHHLSQQLPQSHSMPVQQQSFSSNAPTIRPVNNTRMIAPHMYAPHSYPGPQFAESPAYSENHRFVRGANPGNNKLTSTQTTLSSGYPQEGPRSIDFLNSELPPPKHKSTPPVMHGNADSSVNPTPFSQQAQSGEIYDNLPFNPHNNRHT